MLMRLLEQNLAMNLGLFLAVLVAAALHAGWNTLVKGADDKPLASASVCAGCGVIGLALLPFVSVPAPASWPYGIASGLTHVAYFTMVGKLYRTADLSVAYPVTRGSAPLVTTAVAAGLVGELPSTFAMLGIAGLCLGILALAADGIARGGFDRASLVAALATALVIAFYTIVDGLGGRASEAPIAYAVYIMIAAAVFYLPVFGWLRGRAVLVAARRVWRTGLAGGALSFGAYTIAIVAMTKAPIGVIAALRETSVLFAAAFGALLLGERFGPARYVAAALVAAGLAAMKIG